MNDIIPYAEQMLSSYTDYSDMMNNDAFLPSFLSKNIGRWMKVEHYFGNNIETHIGRLFKVGIDFMVLQLADKNPTTVVCNTKDIKFITIIYDTNKNALV